MATLDTNQIRQQFPFLRQDPAPIYLDSAATAQMPDMVLDAMHAYNTSYKGNVHRGMHEQTARATEEYEKAREKVRKFLNAEDASQIAFTKNCTEALNLVAWSWACVHFADNDGVVLSIMEHHSVIVPWLQYKEAKPLEVHWMETDDELDAILEKGNIKLVCITGQSNVLGTRPDLETIIEKAHKAGARVLVDAAQLVVHHQIDVQKLDCDFLAFSGHKLYGPTGVGVLYMSKDAQKEMCEGSGGGGMIKEVHRDSYIVADAPAKFEGGTPPIAQAIGLGAAIDWLGQFEWKDIEAHEEELTKYAIETLSTIDGLKILGSGSGCLSFTIDDVHPHDLTDILGQKNIALRAGHHCTQPLHEHLGIAASTRLSLALYNTKEEIDALKTGIEEALSILN